MSEPKRPRWRIVLLSIGFLSALCVLYLSLLLDLWPLQLAALVSVIASAWNLATVWRRRYW